MSSKKRITFIARENQKLEAWFYLYVIKSIINIKKHQSGVRLNLKLSIVKYLLLNVQNSEITAQSLFFFPGLGQKCTGVICAGKITVLC